MGNYEQTKINSLMALFGKGAEMGAAGAKERIGKDADLVKATQDNEAADKRAMSQLRLQHDLTRPHEESMEQIALQNAQTQEQYRRDQAGHMANEDRIQKLEAFFGKGGLGAGGGGATGADGKPLGNEAQKQSNLIDTARANLNQTEGLAKEHPIASAVESITPNALAQFFGGPVKKINDSRNASREALQNVYTGASANGHQIPAFQGWTGPGFGDAVTGMKGYDSSNIRDTMNDLQQGYVKQAKPPISSEALSVAGLTNDPMAQFAKKQQESAQESRQNDAVNALKPADKQAYLSAIANPGDPASQNTLKSLQRTYGVGFMSKSGAPKPGYVDVPKTAPSASPATNSPRSGDATAATNGAKTEVSRMRNKRTGQIKIQYSDGSEEIQ